MTTPAPESLDPLLIGGQLAIDFVNSIATPVDTPVEWLHDGSSLLRWLLRSGALPPEQIKDCRSSSSPKALDRVADSAREFREWLRPQLRKVAGRKSVQIPQRDLRPLNALLAESKSHRRLDSGPPPVISVVRDMQDPRQLLQPIAEAAADLLCLEDFTLLRACEGTGCTMMFLDTTKSHRRRWCSMAICGNRAKVAAFRAREGG